jgi:DNA-binding NtrC family response regulator
LERRVALGELVPPPGSESLTPPQAQARERPSDGPRIELDQPLRVARQAWIAVFEKRYLEALLQRHDDNVADAAQAAGVNRVHLYRLLWKHGLRDPESGAGG